MNQFILNNEDIETDLHTGTTVLDFVRYRQNLKGTKIGCREGDCGACTILVGELVNGKVSYRSMTSCLMPLANAARKHIVTIEGINPANGSLTPVQQAMVDESGTQCGFCTVGFVMSLTGFCVDDTTKTAEMAIGSIDGNICRCTGYKSIERAAAKICGVATKSVPPAPLLPEEGWPRLCEAGVVGAAGGVNSAIENVVVPQYFDEIGARLQAFRESDAAVSSAHDRPPAQTGLTYVGGGTDVYVQNPDSMAKAPSAHLFYDDDLRGIRDTGDFIEIGASATVTDLLESPVMQSIFPDLYKHLKLVSSTPIRNMATLAGNFVNASPIGDMTVWFLALNATIVLSSPPGLRRGADASSAGWSPDGVVLREMPLRDLYLGYKQLAKTDNELITSILFKKPVGDFRFNFEKVCKRTYLDIATVNTAISLTVEAEPGRDWVPPALSVPPAPLLPEEGWPRLCEVGVVGVADGAFEKVSTDYKIVDCHIAAGGVAPIPLYLKETSAFLKGKEINPETIAQANEIIQSEISPISDVRGSEEYKRLLLRQLFRAHFVEMFGI